MFKYFPTKRELLLSVLQRWYDEMFGDYTRDLAKVTGARARLRMVVSQHLRSIRESPQLCRVMFREVRAGDDYKGSAVHAMNKRYTGLLLQVVNEGIASGEFRGDIPPALLRDMVYGGIEHHAWMFLTRRGALDAERTADQIVSVLMEGISTGKSK